MSEMKVREATQPKRKEPRFILRCSTYHQTQQVANEVDVALDRCAA